MRVVFSHSSGAPECWIRLRGDDEGVGVVVRTKSVLLVALKGLCRCQLRQYSSVVDRKFLIDMMQVDLDGGLRDVEPPPDLFVRQTIAYQIHDLAFAFGECR